MPIAGAQIVPDIVMALPMLQICRAVPDEAIFDRRRNCDDQLFLLISPEALVPCQPDLAGWIDTQLPAEIRPSVQSGARLQ